MEDFNVSGIAGASLASLRSANDVGERLIISPSLPLRWRRRAAAAMLSNLINAFERGAERRREGETILECSSRKKRGKIII